jgi:hypothetical protein
MLTVNRNARINLRQLTELPHTLAAFATVAIALRLVRVVMDRPVAAKARRNCPKSVAAVVVGLERDAVLKRQQPPPGVWVQSHPLRPLVVKEWRAYRDDGE